MDGTGGWLRYPGGPGGLALLFIGAGLTIIAAVLIVGAHLPKPSPVTDTPATDRGSAERTADALETIAETLKTISGAPQDARNLSVTVRLDENQWKNVRDAAAELRKLSAGIVDRVGEVADKADNIAHSVSDISEEAKHIKAGIESMTGPWGCVSPSCLGTVRFPHNEQASPDESSEVRVDEKCSDPRLWDGGNIPIPTKSDLDAIVKKLKWYRPSSIWILGHASTLGSKNHNDKLSLRRAQFVKCRLKETLKGLSISSKTCAAGEKASTDSLRYPDFRYRLVQVLSGQPPEFLSELQCNGNEILLNP